MLMAACATTKQETSYVEQHRVQTLMDRMDSVIKTKTVVQQDSAWRETILRQFESIKEKSDTSHYVVVDSAGKVIKETTIINNVRETTRESDRQEREMLMHRLDIQDSTMRVLQQQLSHAESLIQSKEKTVVKKVSNPLSWWQQARLWFGNIALVLLAALAGAITFRKKSWMLVLLKKIFAK